MNPLQSPSTPAILYGQDYKKPETRKEPTNDFDVVSILEDDNGDITHKMLEMKKRKFQHKLAEPNEVGALVLLSNGNLTMESADVAIQEKEVPARQLKLPTQAVSIGKQEIVSQPSSSSISSPRKSSPQNTMRASFESIDKEKELVTGSAVQELAKKQKTSHKENKLSPKQLVDKIFKKYADSKASDQVADFIKSMDLDGAHLFYELFQNADDASDTHNPINIFISFIDGFMVFSHNGKEFDDKDVDKICRSSQYKHTDKIDDPNKIGYKGTGFKNAFKYSKLVYVISGHYHFRFDKKYFNKKKIKKTPWQIMPIWSDLSELSDELQEHIASKKHSVNILFKIEDVNYQKLHQEIENIIANPEVILFLRRVNSVHIDFEGRQEIIGLKRDPTVETGVRDIELNNKIHSSWLVRDFKFDIPAKIQEKLRSLPESQCPTRLRKATKSCISFAMKLRGNDLVSLERGAFYCFLPLKENQRGIPFLANAEFIPDNTRSALVKNNAWNIFLFKQIAYMQFKWANEIATTDNMRRNQIFQILSTPKIQAFDETLSDAFARGFLKGARDIPFIPSNSDQNVLLRLSECLIDEIQFFNIVQDDLSAFLFNKRAANDALKSKELFVRLYNKLIKSNTMRVVNPSYTEDEKVLFNFDWLIKLIEQLSHVDAELHYKILKFISVTFNKDEEVEKLRSSKVIMADDGTMALPSEVYLANFDLSNLPNSVKTLMTCKFIHQKIYNKKDKLNKWLAHRLEMSSANRGKLIRDNIIDKLDDPIFKERQANIEIVRFIFNAYLEGDLKDEGMALSKLMLFTTTGTLLEARFAYLANRYHPSLELEGNINKDIFITPDYVNDESQLEKWKEFLIFIKVKENITLKYEINEYSRGQLIDMFGAFIEEYFNYLKKEYEVPRRLLKNDNLNKHHIGDFVYIDFIQLLPDKNYAKIFWKIITNNWSKIKRYSSNPRYLMFSKKDEKAIITYLAYYLKTKECIIGSDSNLHKSEDLYWPGIWPNSSTSATLANLPLSFAILPLDLSEEQATFFNFKVLLSVDDCLRILNKLGANEKLNDLTAYIIVFKQLLKRKEQGQITRQDEEKLKKWNGKLPAQDNTMQVKSNLMYLVTITGHGVPQGSKYMKVIDELKSEGDEICEMFNITQQDEKVEEFIPIEIQLQKGERGGLIDRLKRSLVIIAITEARYRAAKDIEVLSELANKMRRIQIYTAEQLLSNNDSLAKKKVYFNIEQKQLFYVGRWTGNNKIISEIATYLQNYFGLSEVAKDELIHILCLDKEDFEKYISTLDEHDLPHERKKILWELADGILEGEQDLSPLPPSRDNESISIQVSTDTSKSDKQEIDDDALSDIEDVSSPYEAYDEMDMDLILKLRIHEELKGYDKKSKFLLNIRPPLPNGEKADILIIPLIDSTGTPRSIEYFFDKETQLRSSGIKQDSRDDISTDLIYLTDREKCYIVILFPYKKEGSSHWQTGEIRIRKEDKIYKIIISVFDPNGAGIFEQKKEQSIKRILIKKINEIDKKPEIKFLSKGATPFLRRQAITDSTSSGVIMIEDMIKRAQRQPLNTPYTDYAPELRRQHLLLVENRLAPKDKNRNRFTSRHSSIFLAEEDEESQANNNNDKDVDQAGKKSKPNIKKILIDNPDEVDYIQAIERSNSNRNEHGNLFDTRDTNAYSKNSHGPKNGLPGNPSGTNGELLTWKEREEVGRWGESYMYSFLRQKYEHKLNAQAKTNNNKSFTINGYNKKRKFREKIEVIWNSKINGFNAYDISIVKYNDGKKYHTYKVEIKTTLEKSPSPAYFGPRECQQMQIININNRSSNNQSSGNESRVREDYRVYRVYSAGNKSSVWTRKIKNILRRFEEGKEEFLGLRAKI